MFPSVFGAPSSQSILVITGPTGAGKTSLALGLSKANGLKALNTDPFQFYKEIPVISNQTKLSEPDPFVASRSIWEPLSAGDFEEMIKPLINPKTVLVGTGLYLGAALYGLDSPGKRATPFQGEPKFPYRMLVLNPDRENLYNNINHRVDQMIQSGALDEALMVYEELQKRGGLEKFENIASLKAIGLRQLFKFFDQNWSKQRAVEEWKKETRHLAKRQWTWLRKFCAPSVERMWVQDATKEYEKISEFFFGS